MKLIDNEIVDYIRFPFWYSGLGSGTMFLNTIYHIVNTNPGDLEIHVIGCDFDYSDKTKTHFYGSGKLTQETKELLEENASEYSDVAADPFRYGIAALRRELENTLKIPRARKLTLKTLTNQ